MQKLIKAITIFALLAILQLPVSNAQTSRETTLKSNSIALLSDVYKLDLSKYTVIFNGTSVNYDSKFGPNIKEEWVDYTLVRGQDKILASLIFENGILAYCDLDFINGTIPIYTELKAKTVIEQSKSYIQSYQNYITQNYQLDTAYLSSMLSMIDSISEIKSTSIVEGNTKLSVQVTTDRDSSMPLLESIGLIYTENGIDMPRKCVAFAFQNGTLCNIRDTWNLVYSGSTSTISESEALDIAWAAVQQYTLKFYAENGSLCEVKPNLANITQKTTFSMVPRNSAQLYPLWQIEYLFPEMYLEYYGIQVGVWGDTKQIAYCKSLATLGSDSTTPQEGKPSATAIMKGNTDWSLNSFLLGCVAAGTIAIFSFGVIGIKKKRKHN